MKRFIQLVLFLLALPYALMVLYLFINPPSTLMVIGWLSGEKVAQKWVPLASMSPHIKKAVVLSEDSAFCNHYGFDFKQLGKSISKAWKHDKEVTATSTISQQLVKNLYFWPGRSWLRKILEVPLTLWMEMLWSKEKILETYLNVAEWGRNVYGIEAAAKHHFRTSARHLSMAQSALLATSLPNPIQRNASRAGSAQTLLARHLVLRLHTSAPDLGCIR
jgi:monofunctional biosynthetic peptidoglycan transglycosylase